MVYFLGVRPYDFTDKDTGKQITGVTVWLGDDEQKDAAGVIPSKSSLSNETFKDVFGSFAKADELAFQPVVVAFNRFGKLTSIELVTQK